MITIAVVALVVFGPRRLPEIARKAGSVWRQLRDAAAEMKAGIEAEYEDALQPLDEVRRQMGATMPDLESGPTSPLSPPQPPTIPED